MSIFRNQFFVQSNGTGILRLGGKWLTKQFHGCFFNNVMVGKKANLINFFRSYNCSNFGTFVFLCFCGFSTFSRWFLSYFLSGSWPGFSTLSWWFLSKFLSDSWLGSSSFSRWFLSTFLSDSWLGFSTFSLRF